MIAAKTQQDPSTIMNEIYRGIVGGTLSVSSAPSKVLFYTHSKPYEQCRDAIVEDFDAKRKRREAGFEELVEVISSSNPESGICNYLGI